MKMVIESSVGNQIIVRPADSKDAGRIAALCGQLGYPVSQEVARQRIERIRRHEDNALYVAETPDGRVIGWVHVYAYQLLEAELMAQLGGLVVDEEYRRGGAGRLLMQHAEQWAKEKGCWAVHLRSNILRKEAHGFYEKIGYTNIKTQFAFRKVL